MKVQHFVSSSLVIVLLAVAGSARADHHEAPPSEDRTGKYFWVDTATVAKVDAEAGTLTVTDPLGRVTYAVDEATLIRRGSHTVELASLVEGERIAISAHEGLDVRDRPVADTITVVALDPDSGEPATRRPPARD